MHWVIKMVELDVPSEIMFAFLLDILVRITKRKLKWFACLIVGILGG